MECNSFTLEIENRLDLFGNDSWINKITKPDLNLVPKISVQK